MLHQQEKISASRLKAIIGGTIGNLVEWYDWYAYSAFALYFFFFFFPFRQCYGAVAEHSRRVCVGIPDATDRWLVVRNAGR